MRPALISVVGLLVAVGGAVWILQGLSVAFVPQSFMTGSRMWVILGAIAVVGGLALTWWGWTRR